MPRSVPRNLSRHGFLFKNPHTPLFNDANQVVIDRMARFIRDTRDERGTCSTANLVEAGFSSKEITRFQDPAISQAALLSKESGNG